MSKGWRRCNGMDRVRRSVVKLEKGRRLLRRHRRSLKYMNNLRNGAKDLLQYANIANEREQIARQSSNGINSNIGSPAHNPNQDGTPCRPQELTPTLSFSIFGPMCPQWNNLSAPQTSPPLTSFTYVTDLGEEDPFSTESPIDDLPLDLLVRILCRLDHDQLKPSFHVCHKFRQAAIIAQQCHFNYTTPNHNQREEVRWFTLRQENVPESLINLLTPKAPRRVVKQLQSQICIAETQHLAASLFQPSPICDQFGYPSVSYIWGASFHRVLFYEEELCQAVVHSKI